MDGYNSVMQKRQNKKTRKQMVQCFIEDEGVAEKLRKIALSQFVNNVNASYDFEAKYKLREAKQ